MTILSVFSNLFTFRSDGYIGETLWLGNLGHFFVVLSLLASIFAAFAYYRAASSSDQKNQWTRIADILFYSHGFSVIGIFFLLFWMILNHHFEYHYVWRHSSLELPIEYIISCFWEGQEGSFLLWQFWHIVLGVFLIFRLKEWKAPVLSIVSIAQAILASMILGVYFFGYKLGSNPFILLRDVMHEAPIFSQANYLSFIEDGNGLNPLLQNYWMVIHPPVLFLGFASTLIPFAFAFAALWKRDYKGWVDHAISWCVFSGGVLGLGILMGGAWAYESLSFGGFWAWDPVENASLVPWLILVAGTHTLVAYRASKHGLRISFFLIGLMYFFILLSTYLTRSGDLGDTSVHSFTDLGMRPQLLILLFGLTVPFFVFFTRLYKKIPQPEKEEKLFTREFWMFVGSLILLFSSILITYTTCIPIWNKILVPMGFDAIAPPADVEMHHNNRQQYVAIVIGILTACIQFMFYRNENLSQFVKKLGIPTLIAVALTVAISLSLTIQAWQYQLLLFAGLYAVTANIFYMVFASKGDIRISGGSIAHVGFGLMLVGILISQSKQHVISWNLDGINFGDDLSEKDQLENVLLLRGEGKRMGPYTVTYEGFEIKPPNYYYKVKYEMLDENTNEIIESFVLKPNAQLNPEMGLVADPSTKHYLDKDIFTHVTSVPDNSKSESETNLHKVAVGDTFYTTRQFVLLKSLKLDPAIDSIDYGGNITAIGVNLEIHGFDKSRYDARPLMIIEKGSDGSNNVRYVNDMVSDLGLTFSIREINPDAEEISILVKEEDPANDFIIMKAIVFPYINILWLG
ncbi:MAG: cytochrome c biogenesis protein CcsA, partial [Bacteroidia bacterium]|nr:cytochrome c biogenesis protein CcsA [Bacteroidia bacterium]